MQQLYPEASAGESVLSGFRFGTILYALSMKPENGGFRNFITASGVVGQYNLFAVSMDGTRDAIVVCFSISPASAAGL
jgi:hypothetical protein